MSVSTEKPEKYQYDRSELLSLRFGQKYVLPTNALKQVLASKLQKCRKRGKRGGKKEKQACRINNDNLKFISPTFCDLANNSQQKVKLGVVNAHSINSKPCQILDTSINENLDVVVITDRDMDFGLI